jgi:hypothetical protein
MSKGENDLKKLFVVLVVLAVLALAGPALAADEPVPCDPQDNDLCLGFVAIAEMEEDADYHRIDEVSGLPTLFEFNGEDVPRNGTDKHCGSYSVDFDTTESGLRIPYGGVAFGGIGPYTVAMWVEVDVDSNGVIFDATNDTDIDGPRLEYVAAADDFKFSVSYNDGTNYQTTGVTSTSFTSLPSGFHLVAVGLEPIPDPTTNDLVKLWISVDAGAKVTTNIDYPALTLLEDFVLGSDNDDVSPFDGQVDNLMVWARSLNDDDLDAVHNSGTCVAYPFQ